MRKLFQNGEECFRIEKYFVARIEKKSLELNAFTTFLRDSFITSICLVTVKSCFAQNGTLKLGNEYHFYSTCRHKTRTDSVPLQLQDSICEKDIIWNYFQAGYHYEVIVMFLRLYHNINISKRTLERKLSYYGFRRREFSNVTINELKNVIESEIQGPASMRGYRGLWHSLKTNYGIIVQRDIVMNVLKEIDPEGTNMRKARRLRRRKYVSEGPNSCWHADGYDKLKPYGFPIQGCTDGYSRRILWFKVTKSISHAKVPAAYYVDTMKELGVCLTD